MARLSEVRNIVGETDFVTTPTTPQVPVIMNPSSQQIIRVLVEHSTREQPKLSLAELKTIDLAQQIAWKWFRRGLIAGFVVVLFFGMMFGRELIWLTIHR